MATPPNPINLAFASGLDESQEPEVLDPMASFTTLQNTRSERLGGVSKRLGYASLGKLLIDDQNRTNGRRLFAAERQVCIVTNTNLDVFHDGIGKSTRRSRVPETTVRPIPAPTPGLFSETAQYEPICDSLLFQDTNSVEYLALAWRSGDSSAPTVQYAMVAVVDPSTGAVVQGPTSLHFSDNLKVALTKGNGYVQAIIFDEDGTTALMSNLDATDAASIASGWTTATSFASNFVKAGVAVWTAFGAIVAYVNDSGGASQLTVVRIDETGATLSTALNTSSITPDSVDMSEGGTTLWVAWNEDGVIKARGFNPLTLTTTATAATVITASSGDVLNVRAGARDSGDGMVATSLLTGAVRTVAITTSAGATTTDGSEATFGNAYIHGRPTLLNGRVYAHFSGAGLTELALCDCTPDTSGDADLTSYLRPVASPVVRGLFASGGIRTTFSDVATGRAYYLFASRKSGTTSGSALVEYDFDSIDRWEPAAVVGTSYMGGGVLSLFDGTRVIEAGFLVAPRKPGISSVASAGSVTAATGRRYVATYAEVDARGNYHVSGVSTPSDSTGALTSKRVDLTINPLSITMRGSIADTIYASADAVSTLRIQFWATSGTGAAPYYFLGEVENQPNAESISYSDDTAEATLITRATLYGSGNLPGSNGASQDHRAPPGLTHVASYNGMLVGAFGSTLYFSSQPIDGEGQWFSPVFFCPLDEEVTALAVQDGTLLAFTASGAWAISGEYPSDNGASGGLGTPRRLAVDQGCISARSVVTCSLGTFYQSPRGIELMTRGLSNVWVGEKIQNTLASYPVVSAAVLDAVNGLVRISLSATSGSGQVTGNGRDVVYDLALQTWISVDTKRGTDANQPSQSAAMLYLSGAWRYAWLGADGTLFRERSTDDNEAHLDAGNWVTMRAETGWFKTGGLQGRQVLNRVLVLVRNRSEHDLSVELAYNYSTTYETAASWDNTTIAALLADGWPITQLKHEPHDSAESQSVRVRLTDAIATDPPDGDDLGKGSTWLGLTLDITPRPGVFDVPEEAA